MDVVLSLSLNWPEWCSEFALSFLATSLQSVEHDTKDEKEGAVLAEWVWSPAIHNLYYQLCP